MIYLKYKKISKLDIKFIIKSNHIKIILLSLRLKEVI